MNPPIRKSQAWAILCKNLGALFDARPDMASVLDYCRHTLECQGNVNDSDTSPLALYLSKLTGYKVEHGGTDLHQWVGLHFNDGRIVHVDIPRENDFLLADDGKPVKFKGVKRLAEPLWDALDAVKLTYVAEPNNVTGSPQAVFPLHRLAVFVRHCHSWEHDECKGGSQPEHNRIVDQLAAVGWKVFTIWECQIGDGVHLPIMVDALRTLLKGNR
jgi:G:T-mismatch repair DNA endonuclease (very short patch repair protein)